MADYSSAFIAANKNICIKVFSRCEIALLKSQGNNAINPLTRQTSSGLKVCEDIVLSKEHTPLDAWARGMSMEVVLWFSERLHRCLNPQEYFIPA